MLKAAKGKDTAIAVILLTGFGDMDTAIDALRLGADDFLRKPCEIDELCWRIGNCLKKQELQRKVAFYGQGAAGVQLLRQDPPRPAEDEHGRGPGSSWRSTCAGPGVNLSHGCCGMLCPGGERLRAGGHGTDGAVDPDAEAVARTNKISPLFLPFFPS